VGGAEVQQTMLARAFAKEGYEVNVITMDYGQPDGVDIDGIRVYRAHAPQAGLPVLRFLHPRLTSLWSAMKRSDAQIYYQRASGMLTGLVADFCRVHKRHSVFAAASDADFDPLLPFVHLRRDKWLYRHGLSRVNMVIAQTEIQKTACSTHFGRQAIVIPSCYLPPHGCGADRQGHVLWAATLRKMKRPELFIELARRLPFIRFRMIGGADDPEYFKQIRGAASALQNVSFDGFVPYAEVDRYFDCAALFVNTSDAEGFPNTFLQAWARGVPVVSFLDNADIHAGELAGTRARDIDHMAAIVATLMSDDAEWRSASLASLRRFRQRHTREAAVSLYKQVFSELASRPRSGYEHA
jgi:glycosyltransferase involved in cell wall biosynthesis